jgi:hypothetical protein
MMILHVIQKHRSSRIHAFNSLSLIPLWLLFMMLIRLISYTSISSCFIRVFAKAHVFPRPQSWSGYPLTTGCLNSGIVLLFGSSAPYHRLQALRFPRPRTPYPHHNHPHTSLSTANLHRTKPAETPKPNDLLTTILIFRRIRLLFLSSLQSCTLQTTIPRRRTKPLPPMLRFAIQSQNQANIPQFLACAKQPFARQLLRISRHHLKSVFMLHKMWLGRREDFIFSGSSALCKTVIFPISGRRFRMSLVAVSDSLIQSESLADKVME